jgi:PKHD-type hydroxylase
MAAASKWELHTHTVNAYCYYQNVFDNDQIEGIIQAGDKEVLHDAQIGGDFSEPGKVAEDIRKTKISWIPSTEDNAWMFRMLTDITLQANVKWFGMDLQTLESLQYSVYQDGGFYDKHIDHFYQGVGQQPRKLSFVLQLTDPSEYEGGKTLIHNAKDPWPIPQEKGTITFFPSYTLHEVTPVTSGIRRALVGWVLGPRLK